MPKVRALRTVKVNYVWHFIGDVFEVREIDVERLRGTVELLMDDDGGIREVEVDEFTPLPADFPFRELLLNAGYPTIEALYGVDDLTDIRGIGPKSAAAIDEALEAMG